MELGDLQSLDEVVLVDVGGGYGQVHEDVQLHLPNFNGRMMLEDLPQTVDQAIRLENVDVIRCDFFAMEGPMKGTNFVTESDVLQ